MTIVELIIGAIMAVIAVSIILVIAINILVGWLLYKLVKTHPRLALLLLFGMIVIGVMETIDPLTVVAGVSTLVTASIVMVTQYKRLKEVIR